jgi:hypothetical protein
MARADSALRSIRLGLLDKGSEFAVDDAGGTFHPHPRNVSSAQSEDRASRVLIAHHRIAELPSLQCLKAVHVKPEQLWKVCKGD